MASVRSIAPRTSSSVRAIPPDHIRAPSCSRRHQSSSAAAPSARKKSAPSTSAAPCVPGPLISQVTIGSFRYRVMDVENSPATSHGVAPGDSICSPRSSCSVRNDATWGSPPSAATVPTTTTLTIAAGTTTLRHGRRTATNSAISRAPGATLTHAAAVRSAEVMRGWFSAIDRATTTTGAMTASRRPIATGPRSTRNASHHQAPIGGRWLLRTVGPTGVQQERERDRVEHGDHQRPDRRIRGAAARTTDRGGEHRDDRPRRVHPRAREHGPLALVEPEPHPVAVEVEVPERLLGDQDEADEREPAVHEDERDPDGRGGVQQAAEQRDLRGSGRTRPTSGQVIRLARPWTSSRPCSL